MLPINKKIYQLWLNLVILDMANCNVNPLIVELSIRTFILEHENTYFQFIHFIIKKKIIKSIYFKITYLLIFIHTILNYIKCYFSENNSYSA